LATIKDVARHAGVAISTVSAVLNRSAPVSEDTIARVNAAIEATGFTPHGGARSLRSGRSRLIGLVVPNIANPHFASVARVVENACLRAGYMSVVYSSGQDAARESQVLTMMRVQRVAGLILVPTRSDAAHGAALRDQIDVPAVLLDMQVEGLPYEVVKADNVEAGRLATAHLLKRGHTRVGIIDGLPGLATSDDRHKGYTDARRAHGLGPLPELAVAGNFDRDDSYRAALQLLRRKDRPTAIIAVSNMTTIGVMFAARELGLDIPGDLSLVGIDDFELAPLLDPQPTVVVNPILDMANQSITRLLELTEGKRRSTGETQVYPPTLIERRSTRDVRP
jgi:DNA-binding LacI/PurR family transcriptional regulator